VPPQLLSESPCRRSGALTVSFKTSIAGALVIVIENNSIGGGGLLLMV
jgi:hypothetical protein